MIKIMTPLHRRSAKKKSIEARETAGISYQLERKNISRVHLYVKEPDGEVLVTAPLRYPESRIEDFVRSKASWIRKHQGRIRSRSDQSRMALEYKTGEVLYFWGEPYELTVAEDPKVKRGKLVLDPEPDFGVSDEELMRYRHPYGPAGMSKISVADRVKPVSGRACLLIPPGSTAEQREHIVKKKYKTVLEPEAERVLAFWSNETGLRYSEWHSRYMKSRWGSLSVKDKRVCLNTRLAEKPQICLIYVALHEIAHVKEPNHGPGFKAILNRYMPSWREAERILKDK